MKTRIEVQQIVPRFRSRSHALFWLSKWYYPSEHWKDVRWMVYHHYHGRCCYCGRKVGKRWQAHHEDEAYKYLWREQEVLSLMRLVHVHCHKKIEDRKRLLRLARDVRRAIIGS